MKKGKWIIVKNKATYLFLLVIPVGLIKLIMDTLNLLDTNNVSQFIYNVFITLMIVGIGLIFFIKFNTHSNWMNPDHPKSED